MRPQPVLPLVMSTAHPVIDPDRDVLWTVNTALGHAPHRPLGRRAARSSSGRSRARSIPQSVHTITQTRDWLSWPTAPSRSSRRSSPAAPAPSRPTPRARCYLIRKADLEATPPGSRGRRARRFEIAPENNHYYATYDDTDGITILFEHTESADIAMTQRPGDLDALGRPVRPGAARASTASR